MTQLKNTKSLNALTTLLKSRDIAWEGHDSDIYLVKWWSVTPGFTLNPILAH